MEEVFEPETPVVDAHIHLWDFVNEASFRGGGMACAGPPAPAVPLPFASPPRLAPPGACGEASLPGRGVLFSDRLAELFRRLLVL